MEKQPLNRIKVMLAERMLTNKQLAEMLGKDPATISKWDLTGCCNWATSGLW